jgi:murein DD-endopeptidase MepM/ murein hydrolase activator NlpD
VLKVFVIFGRYKIIDPIKESYSTMNLRILTLSLLLLLTLTSLFLIPKKNENHSSETKEEREEEKTQHCQVGLQYGLFLEQPYDLTEGKIKPNQFLSAILSEYEVPYNVIHKLQNTAKDVYPLHRLQAHKPYAILRKDECSAAEYFIYLPNKYSYVVYELSENPQCCIFYKDKEVVLELAEGHIESSLYNALAEGNFHTGLSMEMENILESSISFHHLQKGDCFRFLYEKILVDGEPLGYGEIQAIEFRTGGNFYQAYKFEHEEFGGYYDEEGRAMKKSFLMSPVKYSRISSYYNKSRLHPVLKTKKPHYGTDYAAPHGTEIYAVAAGTVTHAAFGRGNGNYVKIKHDDVYQTQYLHMSRFAKGIKPGVKVKQGQVIGYVGSTGLATGPHVCFRFWKNGKQVNHLKEKLPKTEKLKEGVIEEFFALRDEWIEKMYLYSPSLTLVEAK